MTDCLIMEFFFMLIFWNIWFVFDIGCIHMWLHLRKSVKFGLFLWFVAEIQNFFSADVLNGTIVFNWLSEYVTASPKISKIHAFFTTDFLKFAIFVYIRHIIHRSCFSENQQRPLVFFFFFFGSRSFFFFSWFFAIWFHK